MAGGTIKAPWVSQAQQSVPGGGQAASFHNTSEFMAPGAAAGGLADFAKGLHQFAGAAFEIAIKERQTRQEIAAIQEANEAHRAHNQWISDFQANNRGRNGVNAREAYEAWAKPDMEERLKKWQGLGAEKFLVQNFQSIVTSGLNSMLNFGRQQQDEWMNSEANGRLSLALGDAQKNPEDYLGIVNRALVAKVAAMRLEGKSEAEIEAFAQEYRHGAQKSVALGLAEFGKHEAARKIVLGGLASPLAGSPIITSRFGHRTPPKTPQGPGSSNHMGIDYAVPVGTVVQAAAGGEVVFVGNTDKGGNTIIIDHGNGLTTSYAHLSDFAGTKPGQKVNQGDRIALSGGEKDTPGAGRSTGPHLHFAAKQDGHFVDPEKVLTGGSLPEAEKKILLDQLDKMKLEQEKKAADLEVDLQYQVLKDQVSGLPFDKQTAAFIEVAKGLNHEVREHMMIRFKHDLEFERTRRAANDQVAIDKYLAFAHDNGWTPAQTLAGVRGVAGLSAEGMDKLSKTLEDGTRNKPTAENRAATAELRRLINSGEVVDSTQVEAYVYEHNMTAEQAKSSLSYLEKGGMAGQLKQPMVDEAYKAVRPKMGKSWNIPADLFDRVLSQLKPDEFPTREVLKKIIANLYMDGEAMGSGLFWDGDKNYLKALRDGEGEIWLPDVSREEEKVIRDILKKQKPGLRITDKHIRLFKKHSRDYEDSMGVPLTANEAKLYAELFGTESSN